MLGNVLLKSPAYAGRTKRRLEAIAKTERSRWWPPAWHGGPIVGCQRERGGFRAALSFLRAVIPVTALREALCLVWSSNWAGQRGVSKMSYHQGDRIKLRAHWLAIEFAFYLLGLLTLGAQLASLLTSLPPT